MTDSSAKPPLPEATVTGIPPEFKMPPRPSVGELAAIFAREVHPAVDRHKWSADQAYAALDPHMNNLQLIIFMLADNDGRRRRWLDIYIAKVFSEWNSAATT